MNSIAESFLARASSWLRMYGRFLFVCALAAVLYNPKTGEFGFNAAAKTALLSGGIAGGLSILWAWLLLLKKRWAIVAGLGTTALFLSAFIWRSLASWSAYANGASDKWYAASIITLMAICSLVLVVALIRALAGQKELPGAQAA